MKNAFALAALLLAIYAASVGAAAIADDWQTTVSVPSVGAAMPEIGGNVPERIESFAWACREFGGALRIVRGNLLCVRKGRIIATIRL